MRPTGHRSLPVPHPAPTLPDAPKAAAPDAWARAGLWATGAAAGALFAAALLLWWRHGTTVFFDTLAAGIGACL